MNPAPANNTQTHEEHQAKRLRGGGAGKVRFIQPTLT
jgi:hypothetical protein